MLTAAIDWHVVWMRIAHPDHVFFKAMWTTVYIAVTAQVMGVILGLEVDMLIAAGCVKRVISTYVGGEVLAPTPSDHRPIRARLRLTGGVT